MQVQSGYRAIYRLNDKATFKVQPSCATVTGVTVYVDCQLPTKQLLRLRRPALPTSCPAKSSTLLCVCH